MWITFTLVLFYVLAPAFIIYLCKISTVLKRVGAVVLAYVFGLILGNSGILPSPGPAMQQLLAQSAHHYLSQSEFQQLQFAGKLTETDVVVNRIYHLQELLWTIIIPLALPLLLFSLDLKKWLKLAKGTLLSLVLALVSLIIAVLAGYLLFQDSIEESNKVAGMLVGVYTGGTANLAAIATGLNVRAETFILTNTYDLIIGSVALLFLMTVAQRLFNTFLPKFDMIHKAENEFQLGEEENENIENYDDLVKRKYFPDLLKALGLSIVVVAIGGGISFLFPKSAQDVIAILAITTFGLVASLFKPVNRLQNSFPMGMYLIIIFSLVVSSMANLTEMFQVEYLELFLYVLLVIIGSMIIHVGLAKIFRVDADTTIIAITALTYSPPFVPAVAGAIKNKEIIISGLTIGIMGFAFGTQLGLLLGALLK